LEQGPPSLINGSGGTLDQIATRAAAHPDRYRARGIISRAADISAETRELAGKALQAPVHDSYGTREIGDIAFGCEAMDAGEVHHVMDESVIVEILVDGRPAEPGETGEIVVTDLNNFSVPLIRYRVGDLATAVDESRPCSCGRGLSRIGRIEGRTQASVQLADGSWLPASFFAHFFQDYDFLVRQFQVSQDQPGQLLLQIVKGPQWSLVAEAEVLTELGGIVSGTPIAVLHVDAIPLERPGDDHNLRPGTQP
ncbi:MAG TPA: capsular biosynthesis protein, partial [Actinomycetota bacterium]|nr:capsular biosynthesis protein [Actinomycetota bacterium]